LAPVFKLQDLGGEFDVCFVGLNWISPDRFDIRPHRYTGDWFGIHRGPTPANAIETLRFDGILHPVSAKPLKEIAVSRACRMGIHLMPTRKSASRS
jgi:hypothetical protein